MLDPNLREQEFPSLHGKVYLNTAAEGIPPLSSLDALRQYHEDKSLGMEGRERLFEEFRRTQESAAALFGLTPEEISFCASTSEAYNLLATAVRFSPGEEAVITDLDFPSGATPWLRHPDEPSVRLWKNRDGVLDPDDLSPLLSEKTRLVQISLVSFLTGFRIDWKPVRDLVRSRAPGAILAVDITQAAGRVVVDALDADCLFASGYKWLLGSHGSGLVIVPKRAAHSLTVQAGGWYHLANAFDGDRFTRAESFPGAAGFAVGMPSFPALYTLRRGLETIQRSGIDAIADHSDRLVAQLHEGLAEAGVTTMSPFQPGNSSGIVAFQSESDAALNAFLSGRNIHVMHQAGRIRISIHGYNTADDITEFLEALTAFRKTN